MGCRQPHIIERGPGIINSYSEGTTGADTRTETGHYDSYAGGTGNDHDHA